MGFSVTVSQVIFLVAAIGVGGALVSTAFTVAGDVEEGYRDAWRQRDASLNEVIEVVDDDEFPTYAAGTLRFLVRIVNTGSEVVEIGKLSYFIDGVYANHLVDRVEVIGVDNGTPTDLLLPGETLSVRFEPVENAPTRFKVVTQNGVEAYWKV